MLSFTFKILKYWLRYIGVIGIIAGFIIGIGIGINFLVDTTSPVATVFILALSAMALVTFIQSYLDVKADEDRCRQLGRDANE